MRELSRYLYLAGALPFLVLGIAHVLATPRAPADVKGVAVTTQGRNRQERLQIDQRQDGRGNAYYWIAYVRMRAQPPADGSDISALADNRIAVTPLRLDMTDEPFMTRLAELFD